MYLTINEIPNVSRGDCSSSNTMYTVFSFLLDIFTDCHIEMVHW